MRVNLSAAEHAAYAAAARPLTVAAWLRSLAVRATQPQLVSIDGGTPFVLPVNGIIRLR